MQITQIFSQDAHFPNQLREISSSPKSIYALGNIPKTVMVAIVGTRKLTPYGETQTYQIASELARAGIVIVSGLALGIDAVAHRAALEAGGITVAVMACGLDRIYPAENRLLAREILARGGAIISEYPAGTPPFKSHFIARNRLIAGLSVGTLVVESGDRGGSMFTAKFAGENNRVVMAVPGAVTSETSAGPNNLIHSGAHLIRSSTDVLEALALPTGLIPPPEVAKAQNPHEARILQLLGKGINTNEQLIEATGLAPANFASTISLMEITGKVRNLRGGVWTSK